MAPWELPEFLRERVERGRRLQAEREEYRGSADLQAFIQDMDLTVALHRTFIGEDGQARQGLSERQRRQGVVTFLRGVLLKLALPSFFGHSQGSCTQALYCAIGSLQATATTEALSLLGRLANLSFNLATGKYDILPVTREAAALLSLEWDSYRAAPEQLERYLREQCFNPLLSAADVQRLLLLLQHEVAYKLAALQPGDQAAELWAADERACRQLVELDPGCAAIWLKHCLALRVQTDELTAAIHKALQLAEATNAYFVHLQANLYQAGTLLRLHRNNPSAGSGAEVQGVLICAAEEYRLCKAWLPHMISGMTKEELAELRASIEAILAAQPGEDPLSGLSQDESLVRIEECPCCAACGRQSLSLRKCSACRAVSYCSRECQTQHWKAPGGHRSQCAALAASRSV